MKGAGGVGIVVERFLRGGGSWEWECICYAREIVRRVMFVNVEY